MAILKPPFPRLQRGHPLAQGLIGAWLFTEGTGTVPLNDLSGQGNLATIIDAPAWVGGRAGWALSFDGIDDEVEIGNSLGGPLDGVAPNTQPFTIAFWLYWDSATAQVVAFRDNTAIAGSGTFFPFNSGGSILFRIGGTTSTSGPALSQYTDRWVHWALINTGSVATLYADGVAVGTVAPGSATIVSPWRVMRNGSTTPFQEGLFDDLRFYSRALSRDEVALLYFGGYREFRSPRLLSTSTTQSYTLTGPTSGTVGVASSNFTLTPSAALSGADSITLSDGGAGGTFTPSSLSFASGATAGQTSTYTAASAGTVSISATSGDGLTVSGSPISFTAIPTAAQLDGTPAMASFTSSGTLKTIAKLSGSLAVADFMSSGTLKTIAKLSGSLAVADFTSSGTLKTIAKLSGSPAVAGFTSSGALTNPNAPVVTTADTLLRHRRRRWR